MCVCSLTCNNSYSLKRTSLIIKWDDMLLIQCTRMNMESPIERKMNRSHHDPYTTPTNWHIVSESLRKKSARSSHWTGAAFAYRAAARGTGLRQCMRCEEDKYEKQYAKLPQTHKPHIVDQLGRNANSVFSWAVMQILCSTSECTW